MSDALDLVSALTLEDGRTFGSAALPWQVADARAVLDPNPPNLHFLTRPRGASKTSDLAAVGIAWLAMAPTAARGYAIAGDAAQAALLVDAARGFILRQPALAKFIKVEARRIVSKTRGASIDVVPADGASAYGLRGHLFICDELAVWGSTPNARAVWTAIISAVPKVPGARLVVLTSAGDPGHWSFKVLKRARTSSRWRVHEVPGPCPWISADDLEEQRALLTESQYARLHENVWMAPEDRLVRPEDLAAAVMLDGPLEYQHRADYVIGVDLGLRHDRTAIAVAHAEAVTDRERPARRVVLDRLIVLAGSRAREVMLADVEASIVEAARSYGRAQVILDPWQAIGLRQRLENRRVRVEEHAFTAQSVGRLASTVHLLLRDRLLALPDDEALLDELANVRLRESAPGVLRIDHDPGAHDDRVIALALAATRLVGRGEPGPARITSPARSSERVPTRERARRAGILLPGNRAAARRGIAGLPRVAGRRGVGGRR